MSYELFTRGSQSGEKIGVTCSDCGKQQEILWFPSYHQTYRVKGTTGSASTRTDRKNVKVEGTCECGHVFKNKDLD